MIEMKQVPLPSLGSKVDDSLDLSLCFPGARWVILRGQPTVPLFQFNEGPAAMQLCGYIWTAVGATWG